VCEKEIEIDEKDANETSLLVEEGTKSEDEGTTKHQINSSHLADLPLL